MNDCEKLEEKFNNVLSVNKALNKENKMMDKMTIKLKKEVDMMKCCGNCCHYREYDCYLIHTWEPHKKCVGEGKYQWKSCYR